MNARKIPIHPTLAAGVILQFARILLTHLGAPDALTCLLAGAVLPLLLIGLPLTVYPGLAQRLRSWKKRAFCGGDGPC